MRHREVPEKWAVVELGEVADTQLGKMLSQKAKRSGRPVPYLRNLNVRWHGFDLDDLLTMDFSERELAKYELRPGDVLVCEGGEPGRAAVWRGAVAGMVYQKALHRVRVPRWFLNPELLVYLLERDAVTGHLGGLFTGSTIAHLPQQQLRRYDILVPPRPEQDRIVEALEVHGTRLAVAVAALERVRANVKRYRASVLKAACEGRLVPTEAELARREGREYESADILLKRILKERRAAWEEQELTRLRGLGKDPQDDRWRGKYKGPEGPDLTDLPELPEGWQWATWEQLSRRVTVGHVGPMKDRYVLSGVPFLRSQNVRENRFDPKGLLHIPPDFHQELRKSVIRGGDLVVVRSGSVGVTCVVPSHLGEANCADLVIIQEPLGIVPDFGAFYMNSVAKQAVQRGRVGIALAHFNTKSVAALAVALPPLAEQRRIVAAVEHRLTIADRLSDDLAGAVRRSGALRQSILARAFEGRLVSQNSTEKPASVLLERVRGAGRKADRPRVGSGR